MTWGTWFTGRGDKHTVEMTDPPFSEGPSPNTAKTGGPGFHTPTCFPPQICPGGCTAHPAQQPPAQATSAPSRSRESRAEPSGPAAEGRRPEPGKGPRLWVGLLWGGAPGGGGRCRATSERKDSWSSSASRTPWSAPRAGIQTSCPPALHLHLWLRPADREGAPPGRPRSVRLSR